MCISILLPQGRSVEKKPVIDYDRRVLTHKIWEAYVMLCIILLRKRPINFKGVGFFFEKQKQKTFLFQHFKGIQAVNFFFFFFFFLLKVANIPCFILIAVEIFHNIIRK
jgi:hypothetical protein